MTTRETFLARLRNGAKIAGFGSRQTPDHTLDLMQRFAEVAVKAGARIASGHCDGADLAFEVGACTADPTAFHRCLPWASYNAHITVFGSKACAETVLANLPPHVQEEILAEARTHHPAWNRLSNGGKLLHGRNILIGRGAEYGVTCLSNRPGGGGSGQCLRYLESMDVPVCDLNDQVSLARFAQLVAWLEKEVL